MARRAYGEKGQDPGANVAVSPERENGQNWRFVDLGQLCGGVVWRAWQAILARRYNSKVGLDVL